MKLIFSVTLFFTLAFQGISQMSITSTGNQVKWGEFTKSKNTFGRHCAVISYDGQNVFMYELAGFKKSLLKLDAANLIQEKSKELKLKHKGKKLVAIQTFPFNKGLIIQSSFYDKKTQNVLAYIHTLDKNTFAVSDPILLSKKYSPEANKMLGLVKYYGIYIHKAFVSENESQFMLTELTLGSPVQESNPISCTVESMKCKLYNENFELKSENQYDFPSNNFFIADQQLGNDGKLYILGFPYLKTVKDGVLRNRKTNIYGAPHLCVLDPNTDEMKIVEITPADGELNAAGIKFALNKENSDITVAGLIGQTSNSVSGAFHATYDNDLNEKSFNTIDFENGFIDPSSASANDDKKFLRFPIAEENVIGQEIKHPNFSEYKVNHLLNHPNGSSTLIAEQNYEREERYQSSAGATSNTTPQVKTLSHHFYKDIIAVNFNAAGELQWKTVIKKRQYGIQGFKMHLSYFAYSDGNNVNVLFNEEVSNGNNNGISQLEVKSQSKEMQVALVALNSNGEQNKEHIFELDNKKVHLIPSLCKSINKNTVYLYATSRNGDQIGLIKIP